MLRFIRTMRDNWLLIFLSLSLTILVMMPVIIFPYIDSGSYQGINIAHFGTDVHQYLARGKEVLEHHSLGNSVLHEGKDGQDPYFSYAEKVMLAPVLILGLQDKIDIVSIYNLYNFVGVFFLLIVIYLFCFELSSDKQLSIIASLFVVGGYSIIYNKALFFDDFNMYGRQIYPYVSSIFFFSHCLFLLRSCKVRDLKNDIIAGVIFGASFYIYFYTWTFIAASYFALIVVLILRREFGLSKRVFASFCLGVILGLYNVVSLFGFLRTSMGKQISYFAWSSTGHQPIFSKIGFITMIIFAINFWRLDDDKNRWFVLSLIITGWIALNQQILSGKMLQFGHYYWYFVVPVSIVLSLYLIWGLLPSKIYKELTFLFLTILVFLNTAVGQYRSTLTTVDAKKYEQNYKPILNILNADATDSVVLNSMDPSDSYLIPIYTNHDIFYAGSALLHNTDVQHLKDSLFLYIYLNKSARNSLNEFIENSLSNKNNLKYLNLYYNLEGLSSGFDYYDYMSRLQNNDPTVLVKRTTLINSLDKEYTDKFLKHKDGIVQLFSHYDIKYFVWDKNKDSEFDLSFLSSRITELSKNQGIYLYKYLAI
ncbi:MAG: hypothetical protein HY226_03130 [Candidatus Vogelbacteria bacterium]|nr:hypothetical protein [Candidatus Vogelbacteria bacterium]